MRRFLTIGTVAFFSLVCSASAAPPVTLVRDLGRHVLAHGLPNPTARLLSQSPSLKGHGLKNMVPSDGQSPLVGNLCHPIRIFNVADYGINPQFLVDLKDYFFSLEWDSYLLKQKKIEYLIKTDPAILGHAQPLLKGYYAGERGESSLTPLLRGLTPEQKKQFDTIQSHRRRSVASFKISLDLKNNVLLDRFETGDFDQKAASLADPENDWKIATRRFQEADPAVFSEPLQQLIKQFAMTIFTRHPTTKSIDFVTHFTQIVSRPGDHTASNAPEGVHQDGMDYIVSALVVDYLNAQGGKSIIYGSDKKTPLVEAILGPGYGIFQPDRGTDLWHTVEPIFPQDLESPAYRSTLGFDFTLKPSL